MWFFYWLPFVVFYYLRIRCKFDLKGLRDVAPASFAENVLYGINFLIFKLCTLLKIHVFSSLYTPSLPSPRGYLHDFLHLPGHVSLPFVLMSRTMLLTPGRLTWHALKMSDVSFFTLLIIASITLFYNCWYTNYLFLPEMLNVARVWWYLLLVTDDSKQISVLGVQTSCSCWMNKRSSHLRCATLRKALFWATYDY